MTKWDELDNKDWNQNVADDQIEFLSMLIVQFGDILGDPLIVLIDEQIDKLKAIVKK